MCDQRERLLSYVYDEGDARERAEVQQHLDQCPDCRKEVAGLRSVRSDLLAWEVPAHEPVWRPFAVAPPVPWWRQVPAWAMAAAGGVMLLLGATGSVVAHSFMPERVIAQEAAPTQQTVGSVVTMADLTASEKRVLAELNQQVGEVGARVQRVSNRSGSMQTIEGDHSALVERYRQLLNENRAQWEIIKEMQRELSDLRIDANSTHEAQNQKIRNITNILSK